MAYTMTRADLAQSVYKKIGISYAESEKLVAQVFDEMTQAMCDGDYVKIKDFASFTLKQKTPRTGRNPKTGEEYPIKERQVVLFNPAAKLKKDVA